MGRFSLRLPETLHRQLEVMAEFEGVSLNQYIVYTLAKSSATAYQVRRVSERERTAQKDQYQELMDGLGEAATHEEFMQFMAELEVVEPEPELTPELIEKVNRLLAKSVKA